MCYNISHVGAGIPVVIYVLCAHEYQEMRSVNSANLPAIFLRPAGSDNIQFYKSGLRIQNFKKRVKGFKGSTIKVSKKIVS